MQHANAEAQVAGALEQSAIPAQGDVVGDAAAGLGVIDVTGAFFRRTDHDHGSPAQRGPATFALHVVADGLQLAEQAVQANEAELDAIHASAGTQSW
ncbi:hypothetical protein D9M68_921800 [compost metagenome]